MKISALVGERFRERPSDCTIDSHALMLRGAYMKNVANGIFSSYPPLRRVTRKIEAIIREEMDAVGGQEVQFPVVLPASLWEKSGRFASVGSELVRFKDRNDSPLVLGMTHEEAAVHLVSEYAQSYVKYPFMIYQIQTKFRDEARPRGGLIRVREFTMKDGYSFHTSQRDLEEYYDKCHEAYVRIYARVGLPDVISIASDSGMMGGSVSHEFMLMTPVGEDSIVICSECGYRANMEAAPVISGNEKAAAGGRLEPVYTGDAGTIEEVCGLLGLAPRQTCKAVVYQKWPGGQTVVLFMRGDLEVNEAKLTKFLGADIRPAVISDAPGLVAGNIGPYQLKGDHIVLYDASLQNANDLCCGANRPGYHYRGLDPDRDLEGVSYHDYAKIPEKGICPKCRRESISIRRGIEVGNIFQLGDKYTRSMNMQYADENGELCFPIMGCYGIGVGRVAASVCEARHDEYGPIWPMSIAPWQVHLCCLRSDDRETKEMADTLYADLQRQNIEVLYDDRHVSAGVMFSDADLTGVPLRIVVSPRNRREGCCEIVSRDKTVNRKEPIQTVLPTVWALIGEMTPKP